MKSPSIIYKVSLLLLVMALMPLVIVFFYVFSDLPALRNQMDKAGLSIQSESERRFANVAQIAQKNSKVTIDTLSEKTIKIRLLEISKQMSEFLRSAERDVLLISQLPPNEETYLAFLSARRKSVWFDSDRYDMLPVYSEVSFIDNNGRETIKIWGGSVRTDHRDLSNDANLEFKARALPEEPVVNFFKEGLKLARGQVWVSHIEGRILTDAEAHAGNKNPRGKYSHGVQRFVAPVYRNGKRIGMMMLGLDSIHLLEFIQHVRPLDYERTPLTDLLSGDYLAFLDDAGWLLHPKQYFSKGYDAQGELVPPIDSSNIQEYRARGLYPMHIPRSRVLWGDSGDQYMEAILRSLTSTGEGGFFSEQVIEGKTKVAIWVPVLYGREYGDAVVNRKHGYGFIFASSEWPTFYQSSAELADMIGKESESLSSELRESVVQVRNTVDERSRRAVKRMLLLLVVVALLVLISLAVGIYWIAKPVKLVTEGARAIGEGNLDHRIMVSSADELGQLAEAFNMMASDLQHKDALMRKKTAELAALYSVAKTMSQSHDLDEILKSILVVMLETMGSDRGGIWLEEKDSRDLLLIVQEGFSRKYMDSLGKIDGRNAASALALEYGKPVLMDVSHYPGSEYIPLLQEEGVREFTHAAIMFKDRIVGMVELHYMSPHELSEGEQDAFTSMLSELGVALENARLFGELDRQHKMLQTLYSIEAVVSRSLDLGEIFDKALSSLLEATHTEAGALYSLHGDVLRLETSRGLPRELTEGASMGKIGDGIAGIAAQSKEVVTLDTSQLSGPSLLSSVPTPGFASCVGAPLLSKDTVIGALALGTKKKIVFHQDELDMLLSVGNAIGIASVNARLFNESKDNLARLQKAYKDLQSLDKMKDEFISNVSHELKTPLVSIQGYAELLHDEKLGDLSDKQRGSLKAILRNSDRLLKLINSILFASRLHSGRLEFKRESVDLGELVALCHADFSSIIDRKQLRFESDIPRELKIVGDRDRFFDVIGNLLDNSVKFTPAGGTISLIAWAEEGFVHITVSDTGVGIPSEFVPKLFSRFFQVDSSIARKFGGAGLGLYISKNIIDALKGRIWVESEIDKGTVVHMTIPAVHEEGMG